MAQPMMKEENAVPNAARRKTGVPKGLTPEGFAYAKALERKLGRRLRTIIDGPLSEEEERELLLARAMYEESRPVVPEDFIYRRGKKPQ